MSRPCEGDHPLSPDDCRLCWLYEHDAAYRALWDAAEPPARSLPCAYLGAVTDRLGCACPARWRRRCALHGGCTLEVCKRCPDYQEQ